MEHDWDFETRLCRRCGAAAAEVKDGLRLECARVFDSDGSPKQLVTFGRAGGRIVAELLLSDAVSHERARSRLLAARGSL